MPSFFQRKERGITVAYYRICDKCGANLDPSERCTCSSKRERLERKYDNLLTSNKSNQYTFKFDNNRPYLRAKK